MSSRFESHWYRANNDGSRFALERGVARTWLTPDELSAELYTDEGELRATFRGSVNEETGRIAGTVKLEGRPVGELSLYGYFFQRDEEASPELHLDEDVSILLTDGWTTFGIALPASSGRAGRGKEER